MKFEEDLLEAKFKINSCTANSITINKKVYNNSVILYHTEMLPNWNLNDLSNLTEDDLNLLNKHNPELILLGTGEASVYPNKKALTILYNSQIPFEIMNSTSACRTYNLLVNDNRNVAMGIIIK